MTSKTTKTSLTGVYKRGEKAFSYVVNRIDPATGKRKQVWVSGFPTVKAAGAARAAAMTDMDRGGWVPKTKQTVNDFLDEWLAVKASSVKESTHEQYERYMRLHVRPALGGMPIAAVDAGTLNALYARMLAHGNLNTWCAGKGLSARTVRLTHTVVRSAFKDAVRWGRLVKNPADSANPPSTAAAAPPEQKVWTPEQTDTFLAGVRDNRLAAAWFTAATTGARRGEVLGLRWSDVDLDRGQASIRQTVIVIKHKVVFSTPKTKRGTRTIRLGSETVAVLRAHKVAQARERLAIGSGWVDHDLLFTKVTGEPLQGEHFTRSFQTEAAKLKLPKINLHALRHGWASTALLDGIHPKVVQEALGHSTIAVTLGTYSHVTQSMHTDAAQTVEARFTQSRLKII